MDVCGKSARGKRAKLAASVAAWLEANPRGDFEAFFPMREVVIYYFLLEWRGYGWEGGVVAAR